MTVCGVVALGNSGEGVVTVCGVVVRGNSGESVWSGCVVVWFEVTMVRVCGVW